MVIYLHRVSNDVFTREAKDKDIEKLRNFLTYNILATFFKFIFILLKNKIRQTILDLIAVERRLPSFSASWDFLNYEKKISQAIQRNWFFVLFSFQAPRLHTSSWPLAPNWRF